LTVSFPKFLLTEGSISYIFGIGSQTQEESLLVGVEKTHSSGQDARGPSMNKISFCLQETQIELLRLKLLSILELPFLMQMLENLQTERHL